MSILVNKKSGFQTQKQWPPKCHIRFRKTGSPPPLFMKYSLKIPDFFSASLIFKCQVLYRGSSLPDKISSTELYRLRNFALSGKKLIIFKDANSPKAFQNKTCLTAPVFSSLFNVPQDIMDAWIMSIFSFH